MYAKYLATLRYPGILSYHANIKHNCQSSDAVSFTQIKSHLCLSTMLCNSFTSLVLVVTGTLTLFFYDPVLWFICRSRKLTQHLCPWLNNHFTLSLQLFIWIDAKTWHCKNLATVSALHLTSTRPLKYSTLVLPLDYVRGEPRWLQCHWKHQTQNK